MGRSGIANRRFTSGRERAQYAWLRKRKRDCDPLFVGRVSVDFDRVIFAMFGGGGWPGVVVFPPRGETPADKPHFASEVAARLGEAYPLESLRRASHRIEELQAGTEMFRYKGPTDQPILLIDDVSTTGVTIGAARAALQSAGHTGVVLAVVWAQAV
jgi:phosphoribosylpyrophosphate synthetase